MSNLRNLIRGFGQGTIMRRPGQMTACLAGYASQTRLKYAPASQAYLNADEFWTALANRGAYVACSAADTWYTVCNLSGAGYFGWAMGTYVAGANSQKIRITADGVTATFSEPNCMSGYRLAVGGGWATTPFLTGASNASAVAINSYFDYGFLAKSGNDVTRKIASIYFAPTSVMVAVGIPVLRFEQSLKVEAWTNTNGLTGNNAYAGAAYCLDW